METPEEITELKSYGWTAYRGLTELFYEESQIVGMEPKIDSILFMSDGVIDATAAYGLHNQPVTFKVQIDGEILESTTVFNTPDYVSEE